MDGRGGLAVGGGERSVSTVVGLVLLVGAVAVGSVGILIAGGAAVSETTETATEERVSNTFKQFDSRSADIVTGAGARAEVDHGGSETFDRDAGGRVVVTVSDGDGTREVANESLDALVYDDEDTHIAYQSGAVWRGTGRSATIVSSPTSEYRSKDDAGGTLKLSLTALEGDRAMDGAGLAAEVTDAATTQSAVIGSGTVTVEVSGPYYAAWGEYFEQLIGSEGVVIDHANRTVTAEFISLPPVAERSQSTTGTGFGNVVRAAGDVDVGSGSADIVGPIEASGSVDEELHDNDYAAGSAPPLNITPVIDAKVEAAEENPGEVVEVDSDLGNVGNSLQGNTTYYAPNGIDLDNGDDTTVDLTGGNVTIIVDGDVSVKKADVEVQGNVTDNVSFRVYTTGDLSMKNGEICHGADCDNKGSEHVQTYGTADMQVALWGGDATQYEGAVYAPRQEQVDGPNTAYNGSTNKCDRGDGDDYDTCIVTGSADVYGSIVGGSTTVAQGVGMEYDTTLDGIKPVLVTGELPLPPTLNYLHVTTATVEVSEAD